MGTSGSKNAIAPQVQRRTVDFDWDRCYEVIYGSGDYYNYNNYYPEYGYKKRQEMSAVGEIGEINNEMISKDSEKKKEEKLEEAFMKLANEIATYFIDAYEEECDQSIQCDKEEVYCHALYFAEEAAEEVAWEFGEAFFYGVWGIVTEFLDKEFQKPKGFDVPNDLIRNNTSEVFCECKYSLRN